MPDPDQPKRIRSPAGVDWEAVREEYEHTDISLRALATRWGTHLQAIQRRRDREGWSKNQEAITAKLVTDAVAGMNEPQSPPDVVSKSEKKTKENKRLKEQTPPDNIKPTTSAPPDRDKPTTADNSDHKQAKNHPEQTVVAINLQTERTQARDQHDEKIVSTAKSLAQIHSDEIRAEVRLADRVTELGIHIMDTIQAAMDTQPDEITVARRRSAQQALLSLNPDKDSMSGLLKSMQLLIECGVGMKRRALGMDVFKTGVPAAQQALPSKPVNEVLKRLPEDILMRLRQTAQEISRLPTPQDSVVEGTAEDLSTP